MTNTGQWAGRTAILKSTGARFAILANSSRLVEIQGAAGVHTLAMADFRAHFDIAPEPWDADTLAEAAQSDAVPA